MTSDRKRLLAHLLAIAACAAVAVAMQALLWSWYIEDSAISFAYARNFAAGEGLVPWAGGERVEGFSNPSWVGLLAISELLGGDAMLTAKWYQLVLAALTVGGVYGLTRECIPRDPREWGWWAVPFLAALTWAIHPQAVIWGASGLENALFSAIEAFAAWRLLVEIRRGGWPISALAWFCLAITRPEGFLYAGAACCLGLFLGGRDRLGWWFGWLLAFGAPFTAWHAARYEYFAWPFPQTYYAKVETKDPNVFRWIPNRGWAYVRDWATNTRAVWFVPGWIAGAVGLARWRALAVAGILVLLASAFLLPDQLRFWIPVAVGGLIIAGWRAAERLSRPMPAQAAMLLVLPGTISLVEELHFSGFKLSFGHPSWWNVLPPYLVLGALALALFLGIGGEEGWRGRVTCWVLACLSIGFAIQALGDWMKGFRWLSLTSVPASVLLAIGIRQVAAGVGAWLGRPRIGGLAGLAAVSAWCALSVQTVLQFKKDPETSPGQVHSRVKYMAQVQDKLKLEGPVTDLDVDMGAHLWWSGWHMYDIAGLIDIPFAQHRFNRDFVKEYVFEEIRPEFIHLHGNWASTSRIPTMPEWRAQYVEIPGYPSGPVQLHVGNHIRRDLVLRPGMGDMPDRTATMLDGISLTGWDVPGTMAPAGGFLRIEVHLRSRLRGDNEPFRMLVFLASPDGSAVATFDAAPGYDWITPGSWDPSETFVGKWDFQLPDSLPAGEYDLGFVFLGPSGVVEGPTVDDQGALTGTIGSAVVGGMGDTPARVATGEIRFPGALRLAPREEVEAAAAAARDRAVALAASDRCTDAEQAWYEARMHLPRDRAFANAGRRTVASPLAACYARRAIANPENAIEECLAGREWDPSEPTLAAEIATLADGRYADGETARAASDWETAYHAYSDAVALDPTRSWARRYAEEARAERFGIDDWKERDAAYKRSNQAQGKANRPPPPPRVRSKLEPPAEAPPPVVP
jgi:hypothetical protein